MTFRVGGEEYGLDIGCIAEVIRPLKITPLPRMPEFVEGVINLRGTIIPVVDLKKKLGLGELQSSRQVSLGRERLLVGQLIQPELEPVRQAELRLGHGLAHGRLALQDPDADEALKAEMGGQLHALALQTGVPES